ENRIGSVWGNFKNTGKIRAMIRSLALPRGLEPCFRRERPHYSRLPLRAPQLTRPSQRFCSQYKISPTRTLTAGVYQASRRDDTPLPLCHQPSVLEPFRLPRSENSFARQSSRGTSTESRVLLNWSAPFVVEP